ncbi:response regulator [Sulfurimonas sp. SAG-AH-194-C21]|nr:response regulator [Sulfurimonas sp. SAG-AH-194-C21]MDF1882324.1 response regulator [Sulfurimonas sp. SAG-AH-194-C21]
MSIHDDEDLLFSGDESQDLEEQNIIEKETWKILIVDDEVEMHTITKLTLVGFEFNEKTLEYLHAYSATEAEGILKEHDDIALILLDVVMENDHAGLDLVKHIRNTLDNHNTRIVLRTGQAGLAPERDVVTEYDINDYINKSELSADKLFTILMASLRSYRDIIYLEKGRIELAQANKILADQHKRTQLTLESIGDAVVTTDTQANITYMNKTAERLTGWTKEDAMDKKVSEVLHIINSYTKETVRNPIYKVLEDLKVALLDTHSILVSKDGLEFNVSDSAAPIFDSNNELVGAILVCHDITEAYQIEEALRRSQKMEAIGQLSGGIAHDFNNQLGVVVGYLDFLEEEYEEGDKQLKWIRTAMKASQRCIDLTKQLLSFSRVKTKDKTTLNVNTVIKDMDMMLKRSITPEIELEVVYEDSSWLVDIDAGELQDAILNLTINARDAMPDGGKLRIETANKYLDAAYIRLHSEKISGEYCEITISDTGTGMSKETLEKVFEPFFTTKDKSQGTGLGMSMVYSFMQRFDGFVHIYSEIGYGTEIKLYLPKSKLHKSKSTISVKSDIPHGKEKILVVDDEEDLLDLATHYLESLGYTTFKASCAADALEVLEKEKDFDLLFSDVVMPGGINGYELAVQAQNVQKDLKVLLTSGFTSKSILESVQEKLYEELLTKPYRKIDLAKRVRKILDEGGGK